MKTLLSFAWEAKGLGAEDITQAAFVHVGLFLLDAT